MRKKILTMSIAAVLTGVTSSGVMAFDSIVPGDETEWCAPDLKDANKVDDIVVYPGKLHSLKAPSRLGAYRTPLKPADNPLELEPEGRGDALIYPLYKAKDGWETEIIVRNTDSEHAIVAKASLRRKTDSLEVFDFNIYLSADDVARFTIKEDKTDGGGIIIYSEDGSILRKVPSASSNGNDITKDYFATKDKPFYVDKNTRGRMVRDNGALVGLTDAGAGYVVIFGMGEAKGKNDDKGEDRYHDDHARLFADYRKELDVCRAPWRVGVGKAMLNGTFIRNTIIYTNDDGSNQYSTKVNFSIPAPNQAEDCVPNGGAVAGNYFGDVNKDYKNGLTGTVRIYTATDKDNNKTRDATRDMILPAVAVKNFTDGNKIIYTEGEIAALQDRRILPTNSPVPLTPINAVNASSVSGSLDAMGYIPTYWYQNYGYDNLDSSYVWPGLAPSGNPVGFQDNVQNNLWVWAEYWEPGICKDATAFHVNRTTYTFDAKSVANQLIVTQPYKRILVQMGNDDRYWQDVILPAYEPPVYEEDGKLKSKGHFGGFSSLYNVYNEHEKMTDTLYPISPNNPLTRILRPELASMVNLEKGTEFEGENGFARLWFTNEAGQRKPIPAIITQMIGSTIDIGTTGAPVLVPELNWIYSQFRKTVD
jgi:hypothetical protein